MNDPRWRSFARFSWSNHGYNVCQWSYLHQHVSFGKLSLSFNAAVNGHLELTHLKGRQRFAAVSTSNLEVYKFGIGESSPILFLDMVNLHLIIFEAWWILNERAFYCFIIFFILKWILTSKKQISLVNLHPTLFLQWWILTQLFWKWGELMVNPDLTILTKRWTEAKTWGG